MELNNKEAYKYCSLLCEENIKNELEQYLKGYTLNGESSHNGKFNFCFGNEEGLISLVVGFDYIKLIKTTATLFEKIEIDKHFLMTQTSIERREKGIIVTEMKKKFSTSKRFDYKRVLTDLTEKRIVLSYTTIERLFPNSIMGDWYFEELIKPFSRILKRLPIALEKECDLVTNFSTHMNYYVQWEGGRTIKDNIYPTRTYLNGEEVSDIYGMVDGPDKLYRIYDLYRGTINSRNECDLNSIHLGLLDQDAFDLKGLKGISENEDSLVGTSKQKNDISYMCDILKNKYGYTGEVTDRNSILKALVIIPSKMKPVHISAELDSLKQKEKEVPQKRSKSFVKKLGKLFDGVDQLKFK